MKRIIVYTIIGVILGILLTPIIALVFNEGLGTRFFEVGLRVVLEETKLALIFIITSMSIFGILGAVLADISNNKNQNIYTKRIIVYTIIGVILGIVLTPIIAPILHAAFGLNFVWGSTRAVISTITNMSIFGILGAVLAKISNKRGR